MAQHDYNIANQSGAAFRADLNNALLAIVSQNSGTSAPSTTFAHQLWADTTTSTLKIRNAANSAWIELMQLDGTLTMEDGTALLPGLAFRDDLNTGLFSDAADTLGITTNGVERVEFGTSEVVFNDGGADVDFRIEGDTNANLFFVDAGNDRVGIGTSSPSEKLSINEGNIKLTSTDTFHYIALSNTSTGGRQWTLANAGASDPTGVTAGNLYLRDSTAGANRVAIDSSGRVGIGTTSPSNTLQVVDSGGTTGSVDVGPAANQARIYAASDGIRFGSVSNHDVILRTNNAERARIDSSGRLLVGTSSSIGSGYLFQVKGSASANQALIHGSSSVSGGSDVGQIDWYDNSGNRYAGIAVTAESGTSGSPGRLVFSTTADGASSPTERMRITSAGKFKFSDSGAYISAAGTSHEFRNGSSNNIIRFSNTNATPYGNIIEYEGAAPNSTGQEFLVCQDSSASRFRFRSNGGLANYQSNDVNLCDEREKKNIEALDSTWGCLKNWELKKFHYNEDADTDDKRYGVIAQQVAPHCPEVITDWVKQKAEDAVLDEDGNVVTPAVEEVTRMGVKEQQMMWMAIKALQEAQTRIETLEAEVAALKGA